MRSEDYDALVEDLADSPISDEQFRDLKKQIDRYGIRLISAQPRPRPIGFRAPAERIAPRAR